LEAEVDGEGNVVPQTTPGLPNDPFPDAVDGFNEDTSPDLPSDPPYDPDLPAEIDRLTAERDRLAREIAERTGGSSGGQPQHNPTGAGAGSHSGADGSGTHEPPGVVSFDSGGLGVAQPNPTRVYLNNLAGLVDPYSIDKRQCKNDPKHMQF